MLKLIIIVTICLIIIFLLLSFYSILKLSSIQSRLEEQRDELWQQQEFGKLKKD